MLFQFHQIKYSFFIEVANKTFAKEVQEFIGDAELVWRNDNPKYEGIACIFRYVGLGITLILLIVFWVQTGRQQYKTSAEQRWIMYFMIATIVMDNPLFGFILIYRGGVFSIIDNILNVIGVCFLMLYPLVALGGFITTKMTCRGFFFPRCILILVYGAMLLVVNIYQTIKSIKYPTTTLRDVPGYFVFNFIAIFLYIIWLIWFLYNLIRVFVVTKQHPRAIKGRYRAVICFVVLFSLGFHVLVTIESFDFSIFSGINPVAKVWVANCFCWMMAIVFMPTRAERMTSTTIEGAMHPKQRNVRESIVRSAIEEVTVDDEGEPVVYREQINEIGPGGREGKEKKSPTGTEANEREKVIELEPDFGENDPTANI
ncbi:putative Wnt-binding factor required for Wnt secretion [Monocercomonoides exilis]|uniref:putative Wnt-binding factor required for Wnt secretion n=1 Tax=Monocercomonoides exilis TaxID=2049356 RepID=UPI003559A430|nr:putative Wnt-binding factor required for Wnt secretion [Monocercomonoides exilis]|eukprot:MONOS_3203.1-p1 / transcript=MONOS_3203.1 / gene=MONOS_3203 / organism=Monocercomonoides_exilis_PA203 / gene_product=unspecified product / transcript_product=unspecified product / location=Mono_scaffold00073:79979-81158(+) / protein_length=370 / sequence_SO=supercontig / SO=protein_coding / is_pseudo=false